MSRDRSISALTDEEHRLVAAAEQDLVRLLSLEPSADFAARIRVRIREDERPAWWRGRWVIAAAVAASIVVIAGVAAMLATMGWTPAGKEPQATHAAMGHDVSLPAGKPGPQPTTLVADPTVRIPGSGSRIPDPGSRIPTSGSSTVRVIRPHRTAAPELLIDPRRRDAVDRLLAMVRSGVTDLPVPAPQESTSIVAPDLAVLPVVVEQLEVPLLPVSGGSNEGNK